MCACILQGIGPYVEVAFYHKPLRTLLVTDAVIFVPEKPPEVVSKEALLDAAKNGLAVKLLSKGKEVPDDPVVDDERTRQRGSTDVLQFMQPEMICKFYYEMLMF